MTAPTSPLPSSIPMAGVECGQCLRCHRSMLMSNGAGERHHRGRGLCAPCHATINNKGELHKYPRSNRISSDVLADFHALRAVHPEWTRQQIAEHMGISYAALRQVISRGTRARLGHRSTPLKDAA